MSFEDLEKQVIELQDHVERLKGEAAKRGQVEEALRVRTHELGERVKELRCLYAISNLVVRQDISLEEVLQRTVFLIPAAWQYPEFTCARIMLDSQVFKTDNFKATKWNQSSDIVVNGEHIGTLEICYLEDKPQSDEGPFLKEERNLINTIAKQLGLIIHRKRTEEALHESEELHRITLSSISDAVFVTDENDSFTYICPNVDIIFGYSVQEVNSLGNIKKLLGDNLLNPDELKTLGEIQNIEREITDKGEKKHSLLVNIKRVSIKGGTVLYTCRDITDRKLAEEALSALSKKIISMQEKERARLSHELHDEIGQQLSALRLEIDLLKKRSQSRIKEEQLQALINMVEDSTTELRRICRGLRPTVLDDLGLELALESLVREFEAHRDFVIELSITPVKEHKMDSETAISFYRVLQEALTNIVRHSEAKNVSISFRQENSKLVLNVKDDGKGFSDRTLPGGKGFGILGMRERAALCGGSLEIKSQQGKGTHITMRVPVQK
ncbi:MAG: ATP-binding protein [bacterium]